MKKLMAVLMGLMLSVSFSVTTPALADENEVVALKNNVNDLTDKVSDLQRQLQSLANRPAETAPAGGYVATPGETGGGLIHTVQDINMSGYADVQFNQNLSRQSQNPAITAGSPGNPLRAFDSNMNTFSINQFDLTFYKNPNPEGGVGFNLDLLFGEDARVINAVSTGDAADYVTPLQAYIDVVMPLNFLEGNEILDDTIDIKVGRFVTLAGFEVVRAPDNWNISRSFTFNLAEPLTHTGARATYKLFNDKVTTYLGVNNGWDNVIDNNQFKTLEMGFSINPLEGVSWTTVMYVGPENNSTSGHKRYLVSNVLGWDATDKLSFRAVFDFGHENRVQDLFNANSGTFDTQQRAQWWSWTGYARYQLTEKWGAVYRLEFFRDADYFRTQAANGGQAGSSDSLWAMTFGTDYKIYDGLTGRLEYRLDRSDDRDPFNAQANQSTIGAQLIYNFA